MVLGVRDERVPVTVFSIDVPAADAGLEFSQGPEPSVRSSPAAVAAAIELYRTASTVVLQFRSSTKDRRFSWLERAVTASSVGKVLR